MSYLPDILPQLRLFFSDNLIDDSAIVYDGWFEYEGAPLRWQYPLGLLYDLYAGVSPISDGQRLKSGTDNLPFQLTLHFSDWPDDSLVQPDAEGHILHDSFINNVKEADYLRNGSANQIMSLSKEDSLALWHSVQTFNLDKFNSIYQRLISFKDSTLRYIPVKVYLPVASGAQDKPGHVRVLQFLAPAIDASTKQSLVLSDILHRELSSLFPSRARPALAHPVLHGAVLPLDADMHSLMQFATYLDGWLHITIAI